MRVFSVGDGITETDHGLTKVDGLGIMVGTSHTFQAIPSQPHNFSVSAGKLSVPHFDTTD